MFLHIHPFVLPVLIQAVSPITSRVFSSFYISCFSSYVSSCCQFLYKLFLQSRLLMLASLISAVSTVTALRVSSSYYTGCFSSYFFSRFQQFLQLCLLQFCDRFANRIQDSINTHTYSLSQARKLAPLPRLPSLPDLPPTE